MVLTPEFMHQGRVELVDEQIRCHRGSMEDVLRLNEVPEFDGQEDPEVHHMRINELASWYYFNTRKTATIIFF